MIISPRTAFRRNEAFAGLVAEWGRLDLTVTDPAQLEEVFLLERFRALSVWLYDETGIELPVDGAYLRRCCHRATADRKSEYLTDPYCVT